MITRNVKVDYTQIIRRVLCVIDECPNIEITYEDVFFDICEYVNKVMQNDDELDAIVDSIESFVSDKTFINHKTRKHESK